MRKKLFFIFVLLAHMARVSAADHRLVQDVALVAEFVRECPELPGEIVGHILARADDLSLTPASGVSRQWRDEARRCLNNRIGTMLQECNGNHNAALCDAVKCNMPSTMMALIRRGAQVSHRYDDGKTPLIKACQRGSADVVKVLLSNFYKWTYSGDHLDDKMEKSALEYAIENHYGDVAALLLNNGMRCWKGCSPLHYVAEIGDLAVMKSIVENGVFTLDRAYYPHWKTALQVAQQKGHEEIVAYLMSCGADPDYNPQVDKKFREKRDACQVLMFMALGPLAIGLALFIDLQYISVYAEDMMYGIL